MRSWSAALTDLLACSAPSTVINSMVSRASSGVTSSAMDAESQDMDTQSAARRLHGLEVFAAVVAQAEFERVSHDGLFDRVRMRAELIADRRADEVGAVGVEALAHQRSIWPRSTYPTLIVIFSASGGLSRNLCMSAIAILSPSVWMVYGWSRVEAQVARTTFVAIVDLASSAGGRVLRYS